MEIRNCSSSGLGALTAKLLAVATLCAAIGACSNTSRSNEASVAAPPSASEDYHEVTGAKTVADRAFTAETLYALLVAELAISRKRYDIALGNYVQQAISTNDLEVAARATHIARGLNARQSALEMSQLWLDLDPTNQDARLITSIELIEANYLLEAFELSRQMLKDGEIAAFDSIASKAEKGDIAIVNTLISRYTQLLTEHKQDAGLWLGQSILQLQAGNYEQALAAAERAKALDDDAIRSAFQETRVLHKMGKTELASKRLSELVQQNPDNIGLRARYARLVWSSSPDAAHEQFLILHQQSPHDAEILYSLALVEKDLGQLDAAQARFDLLLARDQYPAAAHFHLGEIYANRKEYDTALQHFKLVGVSQNYVSAMIQATDILLAQNQRTEALALLNSEQQHAQGMALQSLFMLEADILQKAGQMNDAETTLSKGIELFPTSTQLLYARAMSYAQRDIIDAAERDFKRVLELVPENAAALNALGYTLADQTDRYQEAYEYIKQAYALTPDDPAVLDSMGWVAYRLGNYEEALDKLRKAMRAMPDHEIAAHLGEVLWVTGEHQEAISVWRQGLELNPESKIISRTLRRLEAKVD